MWNKKEKLKKSKPFRLNFPLDLGISDKRFGFNFCLYKIVNPNVWIYGITILVALHPYRYSTELLGNVDNKEITDEYQVSLMDEKYGDVSIQYIESIDAYMVHADFKKNGRTELIVVTPEGKTKRYDLTIEMDTYQLTEQ